MTFPTPDIPPVASAVELSYLSHNESTTSTATVPTCQDGDVGVFMAWGTGGGGSTPADISTPSGWTLVGGCVYGSGDRHRLKVFVKLLTSGDSGANLTGITGGQSSSNTVMVLRGLKPISSVAGQDFEGIVTSGNPPAQTVNSASATKKSVVAMSFRAQRNSEGWSPATMSPTETGSINLGPDRIDIKYLEFADDAPSDVTVDAADSGSGNTLASWYIEAE